MAHLENVVIGGMSVAAEQLGHSAQQVDDAVDRIGRVGNPNLLDNWYFVDPINQRGVTEMAISGLSYHLDRWRGDRINLALTDDGLSFAWTSGINNGFISQPIEIERVAGNSVTLSAIIDGELHAYTYEVPQTETDLESLVTNDIRLDFEWRPSQGIAAMVIRNFSHTAKVIKAAKFELGTQQTLAHQDADGNWVLNDPPPNKALELVKCQRYYIPPQISHDPFYTAANATGSYPLFSIPCNLRANPTIINNPLGAPELFSGSGWISCGVSLNAMSETCVILSIMPPSDMYGLFENGRVYLIRYLPALSADL